MESKLLFPREVIILAYDLAEETNCQKAVQETVDQFK